MKHYNIPVFIPEAACPFRCVYCNQFTISGQCEPPEPKQVGAIIETYLETFTEKNRVVELAFFGGSFTGLPLQQQNAYLEVVQPWIKEGKIQGIRISTRPDYITREILQNLKKMHVNAVELGAQSLDDNVLSLAGRGHTSADVYHAAGLLLESGFETGLQMMTGLPGDTERTCMETAQKIIDMGVHTTRIYPTLVLKNTPLEALYKEGKYKSQTLDEAVALSARLYMLFTEANIRVLKTGLHPSESFTEGGELLAGPFHPAFGELVLSKVWENRFEKIPAQKNRAIRLTVHPLQLNAAIGHKAHNRKWLEKNFIKVEFETNEFKDKHQYHVDIY